MREEEIIQRYFTRPGGAAPEPLLGIGDDAAVVQPPPGQSLVITTDSLVAGTHFQPEHPPDSIAHRLLAVNLSDLAAMGAEPLWFTLNLSLPRAEPVWLERFSAGLFALAERHRVGLIGGDTVAGPLAATITACGAVAAEQVLRRDGAGAGEKIFVTGTLGDAAWIWRNPERAAQLAADDPLWRRFAWPEPRLREGLGLRGLATAAIDLSDGLATDLPRLLAASGVGADCHVERLPLSEALCSRVDAGDARALALSGGDDYELCFTVPAVRLRSLERVAAEWDCRLTCIGETTVAPGCRWWLAGAEYQASLTSFSHFDGDPA